MKDIFELISEMLNKNESFVLTTILEKSGSGPREEGTKMLVRRDFSIGETIGGGLVEAMTIKLASKVYNNNEFIIENYSLSNKDASSIGMVCGGDVKILLEYIDCCDKEMAFIYNKAAELNKNNTDFFLITKLSDTKKKISGSDKWICTETGFFGMENEEVQYIVKKIREDFNGMKIQVIKHGNEEYLVEPFLNYESAFIIGAGHVAQKIANIVKDLGFYTVVIDDREEFANVDRFKSADEVKVIESFENITDHLRINKNSYVIIVTRGHDYDKEVLSQVLKTDAKYIGMIGSRKKRDFTYSRLLNEGFTGKDIGRVCCPVGIPIYAETPEEIAVSIAAEMIMVKRGPKK